MGITKRKHAPANVYVSLNQLTLEGFQTPVEQNLINDNRLVVLAQLIPWDEVCAIYLKHFGINSIGRPAISPRIVLSFLIVKHLDNLDNRETMEQIRENMYMQYFLGYSSFTPEPPFDPTLFVEFHKRLGMENLNTINEKIGALRTRIEASKTESKPSDPHQQPNDNNSGSENKGRVIFDTTACPKDIDYPSDLNLSSDAREKSEQLIDILYNASLDENKPRTYRKVARKRYLQTAQKKNKSRKVIRKAVDSQLRLVKRNLNSVNRLLNANSNIPLDKKEHKYLLVINTLYDQQKKMYDSLPHSIEDRIFSIHQPHLCPIVQGKSQTKVEFEQSKTAHGLNRIKARLRNTNESWIACIFLVLNLVKLAGAALPFLLTKIFRRFSAKVMVGSILRFAEEIYIPMILPVVRLNLGKDIIKNLC